MRLALIAALEVAAHDEVALALGQGAHGFIELRLEIAPGNRIVVLQDAMLKHRCGFTLVASHVCASLRGCDVAGRAVKQAFQKGAVR